jgi:hypothetical protein
MLPVAATISFEINNLWKMSLPAAAAAARQPDSGQQLTTVELSTLGQTIQSLATTRGMFAWITAIDGRYPSALTQSLWRPKQSNLLPWREQATAMFDYAQSRSVES